MRPSPSSWAPSAGKTSPPLSKAVSATPSTSATCARYRDDTGAIDRILVPVMNGAQQIPIQELADVKLASGPSMYPR